MFHRVFWIFLAGLLLSGCSTLSPAVVSATPTLPPTRAASVTPSATLSPTPSLTPTQAFTPSPAPTRTKLPFLPTDCPTLTPTPTASETPLVSSTPSPTNTSTVTPTPTDTATPTATSDPSATVTPSVTPGPSQTPTATTTGTVTPTPTQTLTPTPTITWTPHPCPSPTSTPSLTPTHTVTPSSTPQLPELIDLVIDTETLDQFDPGFWRAPPEDITPALRRNGSQCEVDCLGYRWTSTGFSAMMTMLIYRTPDFDKATAAGLGSQTFYLQSGFETYPFPPGGNLPAFTWMGVLAERDLVLISAQGPAVLIFFWHNDSPVDIAAAADSLVRYAGSQADILRNNGFLTSTLQLTPFPR